jgi:hypothetical protein
LGIAIRSIYYIQLLAEYSESSEYRLIVSLNLYHEPELALALSANKNRSAFLPASIHTSPNSQKDPDQHLDRA